MPDFKCLNQKGQSLFKQEESMRLWLHSEFESSLSYMIPCPLKKGRRKRKKKKELFRDRRDGPAVRRACALWFHHDEVWK